MEKTFRDHRLPARRARWLAAAMLLLFHGAVVSATDGPPRDDPQATEPYNTGWAVYVDNDVFVDTDEGYTGGIAVSVSGRRTTEYGFSLDPALQTVNRWLGVGRLYDAPEARRRHSMEFGLSAFTPRRIEDPAPILDDHPYACLAFINNAEQAVLAQRGIVYQTSFAFGLLGTSLCESVQKSLHDVVGDNEPRGWDHQISKGGEPTFRWNLSREQLLIRGAGSGTRQELAGILETAVGYTTQVGAGLSWRWGRIRSPWWSFTPRNAEYINLGSPATGTDTAANEPGEFYVWAGAMLRYRLYNAILQGQFRDSDVEFSRSDLNPLVGEAWIGVTKELGNGLTVSFVFRARSRELKFVESPSWGGVILRRAL